MDEKIKVPKPIRTDDEYKKSFIKDIIKSCENMIYMLNQHEVLNDTETIFKMRNEITEIELNLKY